MLLCEIGQQLAGTLGDCGIGARALRRIAWGFNDFGLAFHELSSGRLRMPPADTQAVTLAGA